MEPNTPGPEFCGQWISRVHGFSPGGSGGQSPGVQASLKELDSSWLRTAPCWGFRVCVPDLLEPRFGSLFFFLTLHLLGLWHNFTKKVSLVIAQLK